MNIAVFLILLFLPATVQGELDGAIEEKIDDFVEALLDCRQLVSLNLAIAYGTDTVLTKGYGVANLEEGTDSTNTTLYGIASLSKAFASTLLGSVLHENSIPWETPVRDILGDDFFFSEWDLTEHASMRDLLAHQMGVPSNNYARLQEDFGRQELSQKIRFFNKTELFRDSYIYNNLMYGLISYVTEVIGGESWEQLMQIHIFEPLGMNATTFTHVIDAEEAEQMMAVPYLPEYDGSWRAVSHTLHSEWGKIGGSGSIVSHADDMAKWLVFQVNQGQSAEGEQVVPEQVVLDTHDRVKVKPHGSDDALYRRPHAPVSYIMDEYALAWTRGYYRGYTMIFHTGTSWGYGALLTLIPDLNIGIHTSITGPDSGYRARRALHMYVIDLLAGIEPFLNTTTACTFPDTKTSRRYSSGPLDDQGSEWFLENDMYEGQYGHFGYGNLSVITNETSGRLQLVYGELGLWDLYSTGDNHTFVGRGLDDVWPMSLSDMAFSDFNDQQGGMTTLTIPSFERRLPPVFTRDLQMAETNEPEGPCA